MKRLGNFEDGPFLTAGEKALVAMLAAGVFGYWAGFNLSTPGLAVPVPVASAAARPVAAQPVRSALPVSERALRPAGAATEPGRGGPRAATF